MSAAHQQSSATKLKSASTIAKTINVNEKLQKVMLAFGAMLQSIFSHKLW